MLAGGRVDHDRVEPVGQVDEQAADIAAVKLGHALDRLGQGEPAAGRRDRGMVADLGLDGHDVAQGDSSEGEEDHDVWNGTVNAIHIDI